MAARCLRSDALSPRAGHVGDRNKKRRHVLSLPAKQTVVRVSYFLEKLLIDFLIFLFEETWDKAEHGLQGKACKPEHSPVCYVDSFLEQLQNLVLIFCWRLKNCRCSCGSWVFCRGVVRFSFVEHCWMECPTFQSSAFRGNWPSSVVRSFMFEMCWIYAERLDLSISKGIVLNEITCKTFRKSLFLLTRNAKQNCYFLRFQTFFKLSLSFAGKWQILCHSCAPS